MLYNTEHNRILNCTHLNIKCEVFNAAIVKVFNARPGSPPSGRSEILVNYTR